VDGLDGARVRRDLGVLRRPLYDPSARPEASPRLLVDRERRVGLLGWTWGSPGLVLAGFSGGLLHIINHALFKCLLFYGAGAVYQATHTVDLERLGGLVRTLPRTSALFLLGGIAISALPPLNGFVSELLIYSGLLSGEAPSASANVALVGTAALLAFVGGVSALSMTRAFGIGFLGRPRDASVHHGGEAPTSMLGPMVVHSLGVVAIGVAPRLGIALFAPVLRLFPIGPSAAMPLSGVAGAIDASRVLAGVLVACAMVAWLRGRSARRSVTWGCGYTAGTPRMQYTGSAMAEFFSRVFESFLPALRRQRLPEGPFPQHEAHVATHYADAVEKRIFEVLGQGEDAVAQASERIPESSSFAFAAGLVVLVTIGILVAGGHK
jgi:hydrogenase-4 component B